MIDRAVYIAVVERCLQLEAGAQLLTKYFPGLRPPDRQQPEAGAPVVHVPYVPRRRITPALDTEIRALWAAGVARTDIAETLSVAYSAVWHRTREG